MSGTRRLLPGNRSPPSKPAKMAQAPLFGARPNRHSLEDDYGEEPSEIADFRNAHHQQHSHEEQHSSSHGNRRGDGVAEPYNRTNPLPSTRGEQHVVSEPFHRNGRSNPGEHHGGAGEQAQQPSVFERQSSGGDQPPSQPRNRFGMRRTRPGYDPDSIRQPPTGPRTLDRKDRIRQRSDPGAQATTVSASGEPELPVARLISPAPPAISEDHAVVMNGPGHARNRTYENHHRRAQSHDSDNHNNGNNTASSSSSSSSSLLRHVMPDGWSCPEQNHARIILNPDKRKMNKYENVSAMVVANKPIPTKPLVDIAKEMGRTISLSLRGDAARSTTQTEHDHDQEAAASAPPPPPPSSSSSPKTIVYYFEVTLTIGRAMWIGVVPADSSLETNSNQSRDHCPYNVSVSRVPGDATGSIGLSSDGTLLVAGNVVEGGLGGAFSFQRNDTLGCGIEILGLRRVFFTKNGKLLGSPRHIELSIEDTMCYPAVALVEGNITVVANFGLGSQPLKWSGDDRRCVASPSERIAVALSGSSGDLDRAVSASSSSRRTSPPQQSQSSSLRRRTSVGGGSMISPASPGQRPGVVSVSGPAPSSKAEMAASSSSKERMDLLVPDDIEFDRDRADKLERYCSIGEGDLGKVEKLLRQCKDRQKQIFKIIDRLVSAEAGAEEIDDALTLSEALNRAVEAGDNYVKSRRNSISPPPTPPPPTVGEGTPEKKASLKREASAEVDALTRKKDIFSLICMLRVNNGEKRVDAALALMSFAKGIRGLPESEAVRLRGEIRSFGGMPSLLSLFMAKSTPYELKVIAAMAVAHLAPSFIANNEFSSLSSGGIGLRIIECLRFLSTCQPVTPRGIEISVEEMLNAATLAAGDFWLTALVPALSSSETAGTNALRDESSDSSPYARSTRPRGRHLQVGPSGGFIEEPQETMEVQELVETAVSLIVHLSKIDSSQVGERRKGETNLASRYTLVEHVCAVDAARPIAVREGILAILVAWLETKDPERILPAATSLRYLTSTQDKYMAGWIHSQIVNEEALKEIVGLLGNPYVGHDVRLAVAEILSSLCVAPHTRAALVNANCTSFLTSLLLDPESPQIVLAAASTLLQLAAGAIARAGVYRGGNLASYEAMSSDKRDDVINDIIHFGAIEKFVEMAGSQERGKLRLTSIEALRVISEDVNPTRQTRLTLCKEGAANALGRVLREDVDNLCQVLKTNGSSVALARRESSGIPARSEALVSRTESGTIPVRSASNKDSLMELYHALCALANILEPAQRDTVTAPMLGYASSNSFDTEEVLLKGCIQTAESGGLQSLLRISSLAHESFGDSANVGKGDFLIESCRSLASLSSLLLTERAADKGLAGWACAVLEALTAVLKQTDATDDKSNAEFSRELQFDALRGIASLAELEPLKLMIVDESLPFLLKAKDSRGEREDISNVASQVCLALGFTEDEIAVQVAGNDPKLLGDWFCLQRSLVIQAMAREEIRRNVSKIWKDPVRELRKKGVLPMKLIRESSGNSSNSSVKSSSNEGSSESKGDDKPLDDLFEFLEEDDGGSKERREILKHYHDIFERGASQSEATQCDMNGDSAPNAYGLLSRHVYPLHQVATEKDWILNHGRAIGKNSKESDVVQISSNPVNSRVLKLLDCCFPSRLLQKQVLPVSDIRPDASYNFGALLMPQRRYFSFRREGQIISRLCDKHAVSTSSEDAHWTLGFTNSTFAGEFKETLVQALYRCPIVQGLSFARNSDWDAIFTSDQENEGEDGSALLVDLFGSLPPWISALTFDGILSERFIKALIEILEMMGKLAAGEEQDNPDSGMQRPTGVGDENVGQKQGSFRCLALRNSPKVGAQAFKDFLCLLGSSRPGPRKSPFKPALSQLRALDLSGNDLGDEVCAKVLDLAHRPHTGCSLEQLDLSRNNIRKGARILNILWVYVKSHRDNQWTGLELEKKSWCSPLHTLSLASNHLCDGNLTMQIFLWLKNSTLKLKSLDLSDNGLKDNPYDDLSDVLCGSLNKNTTLVELDLSGNKFSGAFLNATLERLNQSASHAGVPFLRFDYNVPPLSAEQRGKLGSFVRRSRQVALEIYVHEKEQVSSISDELGGTASRRADAFTQETGLSSIPEKADRRQIMKAASTTDEADERSLVSQSSAGTSSSISRQRGSAHENMITVLFSAPLVYTAEGEGLQPFQKLDFDMERELMWQCLKEACRDIELSFDNATSHRLLATMARRCSCLHYSGHGHTQYLPLENRSGNGAADWIPVNKLGELISQGEDGGGAPFKFVFVSACHSGLAGETFARAGVPHVVCCQQDSELKDAAALAFTRQFYLALAVGRTVKDSFEQGCKAVRLTPNIKDPDEEMKKFVLLPKNGKHDVPVFDARPLLEWPRTGSALRLSSQSRRGRGLMRSRSVNLSGTRSSELSVRNMIQEDPSPTPPQFFLGREVDMHKVLDAILTRRLVSVISPAGYGSSSLVCSLCHYINERRNTITFEAIFYVKAKRSIKNDRKVSLIQPFVKKLQEAKRLSALEPGTDVDTVFDSIFRSLRSKKALVVFDGTELLEGSDEAQDFPLFLSGLFQATANVKVILTGRKSLGIPAFGGVSDYSYQLGPLNFANTVRLFAQLCPHLHTLSERASLFQTLVTDGHQASLCPGDDSIDERTSRLFGLLGNGVPSEIEKAAYAMLKEDLKALQSP